MEAKPKISFGFSKAVPGIGKSNPLAGPKPASLSSAATGKAGPSSALFDEGDSDDDMGRRQSTNHANKAEKLKKGVAGAAPLSRSAKQRTEEALSVDASVFDYDGVYDSMKIGERQAAARREEEKQRRDPKYIAASLASSEQRKLDRTRAEAKKIQREREAEGEEFRDTEAFVTDAYKVQMEEAREAELKEKEKEERDRAKSKGVAGFYKNFMEDNDRAHQTAVEAAARKADLTSSSVLGEKDAQSEKDKEMERLRAVEEARKRGAEVRINDDNEVVDERSLLSAGLNTFGKKNMMMMEDRKGARESWDRRADQTRADRDGARQAREAREAQRERQSKLIEEQMLALEKQREEDARQEEEQRKKMLIRERRNDQSSVASARERALERKRKREIEELERKQQGI